MKNQIVRLLTLVCLFATTNAQTREQESKTHPSESRPVEVVPIQLLTKQERALFDEINLARANPKAYILFLDQYRTYYQGKSVNFPDGRRLITNEGVTAVDDAIAFLRTLEPLSAFEVRKGMVLGAKLHLDDMLKTGHDGHLGTDGSKPEDRLSRFGSWQDSVGENIVYDSHTPRNDVIGLIIDDGVATRGHRKNLFKPTFKVIGISLGQQTSDKVRGVITFAGDFLDKPDPKTPVVTKY